MIMTTGKKMAKKLCNFSVHGYIYYAVVVSNIGNISPFPKNPVEMSCEVFAATTTTSRTGMPLFLSVSPGRINTTRNTSEFEQNQALLSLPDQDNDAIAHATGSCDAETSALSLLTEDGDEKMRLFKSKRMTSSGVAQHHDAMEEANASWEGGSAFPNVSAASSRSTFLGTSTLDDDLLFVDDRADDIIKTGAHTSVDHKGRYSYSLLEKGRKIGGRAVTTFLAIGMLAALLTASSRPWPRNLHGFRDPNIVTIRASPAQERPEDEIVYEKSSNGIVYKNSITRPRTGTPLVGILKGEKDIGGATSTYIDDIVALNEEADEDLDLPWIPGGSDHPRDVIYPDMSLRQSESLALHAHEMLSFMVAKGVDMSMATSGAALPETFAELFGEDFPEKWEERQKKYAANYAAIGMTFEKASFEKYSRPFKEERLWNLLGDLFRHLSLQKISLDDLKVYDPFAKTDFQISVFSNFGSFFATHLLVPRLQAIFKDLDASGVKDELLSSSVNASFAAYAMTNIFLMSYAQSRALLKVKFQQMLTEIKNLVLAQLKNATDGSQADQVLETIAHEVDVMNGGVFFGKDTPAPHESPSTHASACDTSHHRRDVCDASIDDSVAIPVHKSGKRLDYAANRQLSASLLHNSAQAAELAGKSGMSKDRLPKTVGAAQCYREHCPHLSCSDPGSKNWLSTDRKSCYDFCCKSDP